MSENIDPASVPVGETSKETTIKLECLKDSHSDQDRTFTVRALFLRDENVIDMAAMSFVGGTPLGNLSPLAQDRVLAMATAQVGTVKGPDWWRSASDCEISEVVFELAERINRHSIAFQEALKKNKRS